MCLTQQIEEAEGHLAELSRRSEMAAAYAELGCDMRFAGGTINQRRML